ncbi:hypothetical protein SAMD00019534_029600 [Acytostelium subglobosum LB1]|uniref:hypothetical protein n=1 Tax=Acytostelium subglobosum LB1 TaxID=1410327 RepID=UPI000644F38F|nr:hypothetical protein SAMD00019534_029600 [Acytostelium subglobosum LB1]GAM19785.1 hypothetical protein SAMD00019534_029600 [Acytostelium subglobosum LB1]|eukprot:XP_012756547.1 hypothetical protein SAMD00019534_029600 [Acytostelium subglobosum LB1]
MMKQYLQLETFDQQVNIKVYPGLHTCDQTIIYLTHYSSVTISSSDPIDPPTFQCYNTSSFLSVTVGSHLISREVYYHDIFIDGITITGPNQDVVHSLMSFKGNRHFRCAVVMNNVHLSDFFTSVEPLINIVDFNVSLSGSKFNNSVTDNGTIFINNAWKVFIDNCTFSSNSGERGASALNVQGMPALDDSLIVVKNSTFEDNKYKPAVNLVYMMKSIFFGCKFNGNFGYKGGAVSISGNDNDHTEFNNTIFNNNWAVNGSAIYTGYTGVLSLNYCNITNNRVSNIGVIYIEKNDDIMNLLMIDTWFNNNTALGMESPPGKARGLDIYFPANRITITGGYFNDIRIPLFSGFPSWSFSSDDGTNHLSPSDCRPEEQSLYRGTLGWSCFKVEYNPNTINTNGDTSISDDYSYSRDDDSNRQWSGPSRDLLPILSPVILIITFLISWIFIIHEWNRPNIE